MGNAIDILDIKAENVHVGFTGLSLINQYLTIMEFWHHFSQELPIFRGTHESLRQAVVISVLIRSKYIF